MLMDKFIEQWETFLMQDGFESFPVYFPLQITQSNKGLEANENECFQSRKVWYLRGLNKTPFILHIGKTQRSSRNNV